MPAPAPVILPHRAATTDGVQNPFSTRDGTASPATPDSGIRHSSSGETGDLDIIPPCYPARTLVLCFDGTGDQFDADNSNVVAFFSLLKKDDRREQMVYYQTGIGTYSSPQVSAFQAKFDKVLDAMIAWHLDAHVQGGYEFLMQNYQAGDKICLFGFSRGAYTARALAGMIHKVGLLPACNNQQVPFAYKMYTRDDELGWKQSTAFKKAFSIDVDIDFIGVWDTVDSVGVIPRRLPFTSSNKSIRVFRHALALDERRARFQPNLFKRGSKADAQRGTRPGDMPRSDTEYATRVPVAADPHATAPKQSGGGKGKSTLKKKENSERRKQREFERMFNSQDGCEWQGTTDVLEVWFAGCHCDVGGGSVTDDTPHTLARIPLRWMVRECFKTDTGIRFHAELLKQIGLDPAALHPIVIDRPPPIEPSSVHFESAAPPVPYTTEEEHEVRDALSPIYDQLDLAKYWWLLEFLPMKTRVQGPAPEYKEVRRKTINMGQGRVVPKRHTPFYVHRSVKVRMEAKGLVGGPYVPKARYVHEPIWVD
ncbi:hypothetical protein PYCCODRAFT_1436952 [Trametes coccinea BRFM310]|uniref:T6SS Phospholipase effector Tle1-like catalytic domain-containing protein n=1 Tax=Trametes coccinea (strain BRFM310) TaxID=1353009 RepID=A0A1Y2IIA7_TRAC3|nr:hypothetical protein PYCCODRAFT_1436952 [Trametes coccinea BRFM310]